MIKGDKQLQNNINLLHIKCNRNIFYERLFQYVLYKQRYFDLEDVEWMREFVEHPNKRISIYCIIILCNKGVSVKEFNYLIEDNKQDSFWSLKMIELAEKQKCPDTLLFYLDEDGKYINRAILSLKRIKQESYLTSLLLSDNPIAKTVSKIVEI
jgi:hypothetical protein